MQVLVSHCTSVSAFRQVHRAGCRIVGIGPLCFLAGGRKRHISNHGLHFSVLSRPSFLLPLSPALSLHPGPSLGLNTSPGLAAGPGLSLGLDLNSVFFSALCFTFCFCFQYAIKSLIVDSFLLHCSIVDAARIVLFVTFRNMFCIYFEREMYASDIVVVGYS